MVKVVTDSTADIPQELAEQCGIHVVPLNVHFGSETYKDQLELPSDRFFEMLAQSKELARTSQPSPGEFAEVYRALAEDGSSIVSMHLSTHLSGTLQSASLGRQEIGENTEVEIVDSLTASMALGLRVVEIGRLAKAGASFEEIAKTAHESAERGGVFFAVDTLDYLYANGRIGRASHLLGSLLNMKPLLTIKDGVVTPHEKVRGKRRMRARLVEVLQERLPSDRPVSFAVMHANSPETARSLADDVGARFQVREMIIGSLGAVIGAHVGPGSMAVCYLVDK